MKITVTSAVPTRQGLRLGLTIEGRKRSWIRFAVTTLVVEDLDQLCREQLVACLNREVADSDSAQESLQLDLFDQSAS